MFMQDANSFRAAEKIALSLHGLSLGGLSLGPDVCEGGILAGSLVETETGWRAAFSPRVFAGDAASGRTKAGS